MDHVERPTAKTSRALWLALLVGFPLSALFLYLAARNADLRKVQETIAEARPGTVVMALTVVLLVFVLQGLRWRVIVNLGRPTRRRYVAFVFAALACNNVLPGRLGDFLRARWLSHETRQPYGRALAAVAVDRVFDVIALLLFVCISAPLVISQGWLLRIAIGGAVLLVVFALVRVVARRYTNSRERGRRVRGIVRRVVRDTLEGLAEPLGRLRIVTALALSVAAWCVWGVAAMLIASSVGIELGLVDALFVSAIVNLGAAIPSSPGYVGTAHWLGVQSLALLGVGVEDALAFAILMHAVWYVPTTLAGAVVLVARTGRILGGDKPRSPMPSAQLARAPVSAREQA